MNSSFVLRCVVAGVFAFVPLALGAQSKSEALSQLENAMRQEIALDSKDVDRQRSNERRTMIAVQLHSWTERGEASQLEEVLRQVLLTFSSDEVRVACENLRVAVQAERDSKEKASIEKMQALLEQTRNAVKNAGKPADLDAIIRDLSFSRDQREINTERTRTLADQLQNARNFAMAWQDYLAHRLAGRTKLAQQALQNVANYSNADILPRSEILARLEEITKTEEASAQRTSPYTRLREIMAKTKTLDDLQGAIDAVRELQGQSKTSVRLEDPAVQLYEELVRIQHGYKDFRAGAPTIVQVRSETRPIASEAVELAGSLKIALARLVLPRFLQVQEKPAADELVDGYVERMMKLAFERCDPRLIQRVYHVRNAINGNGNAFQFSLGLDALMAARNQDDAGQFLPAVISYQRALRFGGELVPVESVGKRLAAIKAAHPAEYEAGMKKFLDQSNVDLPHPASPDGPFSLRVPAADHPDQ